MLMVRRKSAKVKGPEDPNFRLDRGDHRPYLTAPKQASRVQQKFQESENSEGHDDGALSSSSAMLPSPPPQRSTFRKAKPPDSRWATQDCYETTKYREWDSNPHGLLARGF